MSLTETLDQLKDHIAAAQSMIVLLGPKATYDQVATGLALTESLQTAGKEVVVACPVEVAASMGNLIGVESIQQKLGNQNLSIKFPYQAEAVDKVSYHISDDNETFYLIIKPQKGYKPLDANQVTFDYTGADSDMIFLIGVHEVESLEHLYQGYEELFEQATVVSIHTFETEVGNLKIDISKYGSYSQAMASMFQHLELSLSGNAPTNLLAGIELTTEGFTSITTTADTFETVAQLMRQGARRLKPYKPAVVVAKSTPRAVSDTTSFAHGLARPSSKSGSSNAVSFSSNISNESDPYTLDEAEDGEVNYEVLDHKDDVASDDIEASIAAASEATFSPSVKKKKAKKATSRPGGLNYQPGAEGSMGRG